MQDNKLKQFMSILTAGTQTWLTVFVTTVYNVTLLIAMYFGKLTAQEYIQAIGPVNLMVVSFWLGAETALRQPKIPPSE